jgi:hypothetical protein
MLTHGHFPYSRPHHMGSVKKTDQGRSNTHTFRSRPLFDSKSYFSYFQGFGLILLRPKPHLPFLFPCHRMGR